MVFKKYYANEADAKVIERKLKKFKNRAIIENIIKDQEIRMGP